MTGYRLVTIFLLVWITGSMITLSEAKYKRHPKPLAYWKKLNKDRHWNNE